jgi:hypothetical protein
MNVNAADLALCAARTRMLAERLSDAERDELILAWAEMVTSSTHHRRTQK